MNIEEYIKNYIKNYVESEAQELNDYILSDSDEVLIQERFLEKVRTSPFLRYFLMLDRGMI